MGVELCIWVMWRATYAAVGLHVVVMISTSMDMTTSILEMDVLESRDAGVRTRQIVFGPQATSSRTPEGPWFIWG
jgi:hypothetical protein